MAINSLQSVNLNTSVKSENTFTKSAEAYKLDIQSAYASEFDKIEYYIQNGQFDKAAEIYDNVKSEIPNFNMYYDLDLTERMFDTFTDDAYQMTTGEDLTDTIKNNTKSSFGTGLLEGIPFYGWFFQEGISEAEAMVKFDNTEVAPVEKGKEIAGAALGGGAPTALAGAAIGTAICPGFGTLIGAGIGASAGTLSGVLSCLFKNGN